MIRLFVLLLACSAAAASCSSEGTQVHGFVKKHVREEVRALLAHGELVSPDKHPWLCCDPREVRAKLSTPGGDAGEVFLAIAAFVRLEGANYSCVPRLLAHVVEQRQIAGEKDLYMHTDAKTVARVESALGTHMHWSSPPEDVRVEALALLLDPANQGCRYFRSLLEHPQRYEVPVELTRAFLRAFYELLWFPSQHKGVQLAVLHGEPPADVVVVNVTTEASEACSSLAPLVQLRRDHTQMMVFHTQFVDAVRQKNAQLVSTLGKTSTEALASEIRRLGHNHHGELVRALSLAVHTEQVRVTVQLSPQGITSRDWMIIVLSVVTWTVFGSTVVYYYSTFRMLRNGTKQWRSAELDRRMRRAGGVHPP